MPTREIITHSTEETIALGRELAAQLRAPVLVCLEGELGAGKTTLAKGIISGLGVAREEDVTSPTFTLVHVFRKAPDVIPSPDNVATRNLSSAANAPARAQEGSFASLRMTGGGAAPASLKVFHVDLYRVADRHDLDTLGLEDLFAEPAIVLVEWPERLQVRTEWPVIQIRLEHGNAETRHIRIDDARK